MIEELLFRIFTGMLCKTAMQSLPDKVKCGLNGDRPLLNRKQDNIEAINFCVNMRT